MLMTMKQSFFDVTSFLAMPSWSHEHFWPQRPELGPELCALRFCRLCKSEQPTVAEVQACVVPCRLTSEVPMYFVAI